MKNLGNKISSIATPIVRMVGADCIDPKTNDLRPESKCAKAKQQLNNGVPVWDVFYERFFGSKEQKQQTEGDNKVLFIVHVAVEADDVRAAVAKIPAEFPIRAVMQGPPQQNAGQTAAMAARVAQQGAK